jgi:hypothetical protein
MRFVATDARDPFPCDATPPPPLLLLPPAAAAAASAARGGDDGGGWASRSDGGVSAGSGRRAAAARAALHLRQGGLMRRIGFFYVSDGLLGGIKGGRVLYRSMMSLLSQHLEERWMLGGGWRVEGGGWRVVVQE